MKDQLRGLILRGKILLCAQKIISVSLLQIRQLLPVVLNIGLHRVDLLDQVVDHPVLIFKSAVDLIQLDLILSVHDIGSIL